MLVTGGGLAEGGPAEEGGVGSVLGSALRRSSSPRRDDLRVEQWV